MPFLLSVVFLCSVLHCNGNIILEKHLDFMHCVASRFVYPKYRLSELSLVPISSDNRRSTVFVTLNNLRRKEVIGTIHNINIVLLKVATLQCNIYHVGTG